MMRRVYKLLSVLFAISCIVPTRVSCEDDEATSFTTKDIPSLEYWNENIPGAEIPDEAITERMLPKEITSVSETHAHIHTALAMNADRESMSVSEGEEGAKADGGYGFNVGKVLFYPSYVDRSMVLDITKSLFFLEKDLHVGIKTTLQFMHQQLNNNSYFLPPAVARTIPFSLGRLGTVMRILEVSANSKLALQMKSTLRHCQMGASGSEHEGCATSLEGMVDFVTNTLGTNEVHVVTTHAPKVIKFQNYTLTRFTRDPAFSRFVTCHNMPYPYVVYLCHAAPNSSTAEVELVGDDGAKVVAQVVCHHDTNSWNPTDIAIEVLEVRPGEASICHFIPDYHLVWLLDN